MNAALEQGNQPQLSFYDKPQRIYLVAGISPNSHHKEYATLNISQVSSEYFSGVTQQENRALSDKPVRVQILYNIENQQAIGSDGELEEIFRGLVKIWQDATGGLSSPKRKFAHPTYRAILKLGPSTVPFILGELQQRPDWWFDALEFLTRAHPAKPTDSFEEAVNAWINWGKSNNLIR
jgi:hypothetical protein